MTNQYMSKVPAYHRFWAMVRQGPGCWLWQGAKSREGYGFFSPTHNKQVRAHRYAWELVYGPIPAGKQLDHLCRVPSCVRPEHLQVVTSRENTLRGTTGPAINARKTHCPRGHAYNQVRAGRRRCIPCERAQERARYHAKRAVPGLRGE